MKVVLRVAVVLVAMAIVGCATIHENNKSNDYALVSYLNASVQDNLSLVRPIYVNEKQLEDVVADSEGMVIVLFYTNEDMYIEYSAMLVMLHKRYQNAKICAFTVSDGGMENKNNRDMLYKYKLENLPTLLIFQNLSNDKVPTVKVTSKITGLSSLKFFFDITTRVVDTYVQS